MAYGHPNLSVAVPTFVAFATCPQFQQVDPPRFDSYDLSKGSGESLRDLTKRREILYQRRLDSDVETAVELLFNSWPTQTSTPPTLIRSNSYYIDTPNSNLATFFSDCYRNCWLKEYVKHVQVILNDAYKRGVTAASQEYEFKPVTDIPTRTSWSLAAEQLFSRPARLLPPCVGMASHHIDVKLEDDSSSGTTPLDQLITAINTNATNPFQRQYVTDLQASAEHFARDSPLVANGATERPPTEALRKQYAECRASYLDTLEDIRRKLGPAGRNGGECALAESGHWPRITPDSLFVCLASASPFKLPQVWRRNITTFATLALNLQRARRLLCLDLDNLHEEFMKESENRGFDGWDAETYPD